MQSLLEVIANRITLAAEEHTAMQKASRDMAAKLVMAVARKIAGDAMKREPYAGLERLLGECSALVTGSPKIQVVVAPARLDSLRQRIDMLKPLVAGFDGEIEATSDALLADQDCRRRMEKRLRRAQRYCALEGNGDTRPAGVPHLTPCATQPLKEKLHGGKYGFGAALSQVRPTRRI